MLQVSPAITLSNPYHAPRSARRRRRISGDGTNWGDLNSAININSGLSKYARPGAWNDPDLLVGTGIGSNSGPDACYDPTEISQTSEWYMTDLQSRAQFSMWCVMSSPLLISANLAQVSQFALETWGNEEAIYINQNFRKYGDEVDDEQKIYQGIRVSGEDLAYDKPTNSGSGNNVWAKPLPDRKWGMVFLNNENEVSDVVCDADCFAQLWDLDTSGGVKYQVRDLWTHEDEGDLLVAAADGGFAYTAKSLDPLGGVKIVIISPVN